MEKDLPTIEHEEYQETCQDRETWEHVIGGTRELREHATSLLPQFPLEHKDDYQVRCDTATFHNVTGKTREVLCGLAFQKPITLSDDVPPEIVKLCENIDNRGNHLDVFARNVFEDSFDGWSVILVDCPTAKVSDLGEQKALGIRPYAVAYKACDVINWDYQINPVSRKRELSLIVLKETTSQKGGRFMRKDVTQYRVFYLENGRVFWQLWEEQENDKKEKVVVQIVEDTLIPKLNAIPCAAIGELGAKPPLMDLAYTNIKYAQKESDYDTIIHKTCVPLPFVTNITAEELGQAKLGGVMYCLPEKSTIGFAEVSGGSIAAARTNLEDLKVDMAWLGLQMLMPRPAGGSTATEYVGDMIQDTSALQVKATQAKDAIELTFSFMAQYMNLGNDAGGSIELGCSWQQMSLTTNDIQALNTLVVDGNYPREAFLWYLERSGKLPPDMTADDAAEILDGEEQAMLANEKKNTLTALKNAQAMPNDTTKTQTQTTTAVPDSGANQAGVAVS